MFITRLFLTIAFLLPATLAECPNQCDSLGLPFDTNKEVTDDGVTLQCKDIKATLEDLDALSPDCFYTSAISVLCCDVPCDDETAALNSCMIDKCPECDMSRRLDESVETVCDQWGSEENKNKIKEVKTCCSACKSKIEAVDSCMDDECNGGFVTGTILPLVSLSGITMLLSIFS